MSKKRTSFLSVWLKEKQFLRSKAPNILHKANPSENELPNTTCYKKLIRPRKKGVENIQKRVPKIEKQKTLPQMYWPHERIQNHTSRLYNH